MGQLRDIHDEILALGFQVIAISPDRPEKVKAAAKGQKLDYTLLSDTGLEVARALGLAFRVSDETNETLKKYDIDIEEASGEEHHWLPVPAVYLVDTDRTVLFQYVNPDYKVRIHGEVLLAAARAYAE